MTDANQVWDVSTAIKWMKSLSKFDIYWIEEPTSPDDVMGKSPPPSPPSDLSTLSLTACPLFLRPLFSRPASPLFFFFLPLSPNRPQENRRSIEPSRNSSSNGRALPKQSDVQTIHSKWCFTSGTTRYGEIKFYPRNIVRSYFS